MKKKVLFLYDKNNSWSFKYLKKFIEELKIIFIKKFTFKISSNKNITEKFHITFLNNLTYKIDINNKNFGLILLIHESDLPKNKGFAPLQWQFLENKNDIFFSLIKADNNLDSGHIILKQKFKFDSLDLYEDIRTKQFFFQKTLISNFLEIYPNFTLKKQKGKSTYNRKRTFLDSKIDLNKTIKSQFNHLRVANSKSWPNFFIHNNKIFKIKIEKTSSDKLVNLKIRNPNTTDKKMIYDLYKKYINKNNFIFPINLSTNFSPVFKKNTTIIKVGYSQNTNDVIGFVRYDKYDDVSYKIFIFILPKFRGLKLSLPLFAKSLKFFKKKNISIIVEIPNNKQKSYIIFDKLKFKLYRKTKISKFYKNSLENINRFINYEN